MKSSMSCEVFIHKVDGLSEDTRMEVNQEVYQRVIDHLEDLGIAHLPVRY